MRRAMHYLLALALLLPGIVAAQNLGTLPFSGGTSVDLTAPGPIGGTTPSTGAFTSVTASAGITSGAQVTAASFRGTGLTAGRVPYIGTNGLIQDTANLLYSETASVGGGAQLTVGNGSGTSAGWVLGSQAAANSGLWPTGVTPSASNFSLLGFATGIYVNAASGSGNLSIGATPVATWQTGSFTPANDGSQTSGTAAKRWAASHAYTYLTGAPTTQTGATYTVATTDTYIIANASATQTLTLPAAASFTGRRLVVKTIAAFTVVSASSNVVPQAGGAAGTAILAATTGKFAELISDGTNWVIFAAN